jgi:hypothetical protein
LFVNSMAYAHIAWLAIFVLSPGIEQWRIDGCGTAGQ